MKRGQIQFKWPMAFFPGRLGFLVIRVWPLFMVLLSFLKGIGYHDGFIRRGFFLVVTG